MSRPMTNREYFFRRQRINWSTEGMRPAVRRDAVDQADEMVDGVQDEIQAGEQPQETRSA